MWFRKVFIWVLLVCGLFSHSLMAEDTNQSKEYTFLKFFQQVKTTSDIFTVISKVTPIVDFSKTTIVDTLLKAKINTYKEMSSLYNERFKQGI